MKISPLSAAQISVPGRDARYKLKRGEWKEIAGERDYFFLLAPRSSAPALECDAELGPVWVHPRRDAEVPVFNKSGNRDKIQLRAGVLKALPRVQAHQLTSHPALMLAKVSVLLSAKPAARVAILRDLGLGDVVFLTGTLRELRSRYPQAQIDFVTLGKHADLVGGITIEQALSRAPYDGVWNLVHTLETHKDRSRFDRVTLFAREAGLDDAWPLEVHVSPEDISYGEEAASGAVLLALQGSNPWRHQSLDWNYQLAEKLSDYPRLAVGWNKHDWPGDVASLEGMLSTGQLAGCIKACRAIVAVDSGPLNLAQALGTKGVGIFGPIDPALRIRPESNIVAVSAKPLPYCPCNLEAEQRKCTDDRSALLKCFLSVQHEQVVSALKEVLRGDS